MRSSPTDTALLQAAKESVVGLLPQLPVAARNEAKLVIKALDCVVSRLHRGTDDDVEAKREIAELGHQMGMSLDQFAQAIRAGIFEANPARSEQARDLLERMTAKKLAEDNPYYPR